MNRWNIVAGWYQYLRQTHGGQHCSKYARLCKVQTYYSPGSEFYGEVESLSEGANEVYETLMSDYFDVDVSRLVSAGWQVFQTEDGGWYAEGDGSEGPVAMAFNRKGPCIEWATGMCFS